MRRRNFRLVGAAVPAFAILVGVPAAAMAATWDYTRDSGMGGKGRTYGTMTFRSATLVDHVGVTTDICPKDGVGTSYYLNAAQTVPYYVNSGYVALDTSGCDDGQNGGGSGTVYASSGAQITQARAVLCWTNDGNPCWATTINPGVWKDNPYQ